MMSLRAHGDCSKDKHIQIKTYEKNYVVNFELCQGHNYKECMSYPAFKVVLGDPIDAQALAE